MNTYLGMTITTYRCRPYYDGLLRTLYRLEASQRVFNRIVTRSDEYRCIGTEHSAPPRVKLERISSGNAPSDLSRGGQSASLFEEPHFARTEASHLGDASLLPTAPTFQLYRFSVNTI